MRKNRIAALALAGILSVSLLGGCMDDDWEDETEYEEELDDEDEDDEDSENSDLQAYGEAGVVDDSLEYGSGAALCEAEGALDANPTRAVRRSTTPINQTVNTMLDGTPVPEDFYMYRKTLSSQYQKAYDQICAGMANGESPIVMSVAVPKEDIADVYWCVVNDHPEFFWVSANMNYSYNNNGLVTEVKPVYYQGSPSQYNSEVAANVDQALADMWALGSDIDKVKYAHDYLTNSINYTHNDMDQTAYSGFVWKQTVCAGYARCFAYMMHKMGIPCAVVIGDAGEPHAWNILYLDGDYYMMDVTWDDPIGNPSNTYYYNYFNITNGQISKDHTIGRSDLNISLALPVANGTAYSFQNYYGGSAYGTNFDAINGQMPEQTSYDDDDGYYEEDDDEYEEDDDDDEYEEDDDDGQDYYEYSNYDEDSGWWNMLDETWTQDDWTYDEEGYWYIYDDETEYYYLYVEDEGVFGAMTEDQETIYWLDNETGEWIEQ